LILNKIIKILLSFICNIITFLFCTIISRTDKIWVFGSWFGESFSDNTKYLFLYCNKYKDELNLDKVIWITDNNEVYKELKKSGFIVYKKWSLKSIWYHTRAKRHFICQVPNDINPYFSAKAVRIQLWHGVGFKKLNTIEEIPNINSIKYKFIYFLKRIFYYGGWHKCIFLSTSKYATDKIFKYSFRLWENDIIESKYPRDIYLNLDEVEKEKIIHLNRKEKIIKDIIYKNKYNKKILLYLPTYRNDATINNKKTSYPLNIQNEYEFKSFIDFLNNNNILFLSKFHFAGDLSINDNNESFYTLDNNFDIYTILNEIDLLITDYSSVYADFLFIDKPIIFFTYDLDKYQNNDKGFIGDFNLLTPGDKVYDIEKLKERIIYNLNNDDYIYERKKIKELYFDENIDDTYNIFLKKIIYN
jgi:CDP-glycerol glycerophosphotransferase